MSFGSHNKNLPKGAWSKFLNVFLQKPSFLKKNKFWKWRKEQAVHAQGDVLPLRIFLSVIPRFFIPSLYVPNISSNLAVLQGKGTFWFGGIPGLQGLGWIPASVGNCQCVREQLTPFLPGLSYL